ncbi:MAG: hypothetical protein U0W40_08525 [Acidimicrobiia bacterium]
MTTVPDPPPAVTAGVCPMCGGPVAAGAERCPDCGLSLMGVDGRPGRSPAAPSGGGRARCSPSTSWCWRSSSPPADGSLTGTTGGPTVGRPRRVK